MTEYSAFIFVAFFLSEYCSMVVLSTLTATLFFGGFSSNLVNIDIFGISLSSILLGTKACFLVFCIIWVRATLPRVRYDQLQVLCWTVLLPLIFGLLVLVISLYIVFNA